MTDATGCIGLDHAHAVTHDRSTAKWWSNRFLSDVPSGHQLDCIAFGQERLNVAEIETCSELGKGLQLRSQYDDVPVHVRLPLARRWRRGTDRDPSCPRRNNAALRWAIRDESICEACAKHLVDSDLPLDDWY